MPVALEQCGAKSLVRLDGDIDVSCSAELKDCLLRGLESGSALGVSLELVTGMDVTAVQLLWAAARDAQCRGVEFALAADAPEPVRALLNTAGLWEFPVPA